MRVPIEWLKEFVAIRLTPEMLAERLTMVGLEVVAVDHVDGQPVLDVEVTPNRADCLSIIGVAREIAAITGQRLKLPLGARGQGPGAREKRHPGPRSPVPGPFTVRIEDRKGCPRYIGRLIDGVRVGPSPDWIQRRLLACGARPINNVVDITNYVLLELGQPLHAFDAQRLAECAIVVRRARAGERLTTLDGVARALTHEALVIADAQRPVALAGVIGGQESGVTESTTAVVLESAAFDPVLVRRTARRLGVSSESSYRFERGVDPAAVAAASVRAAALITQLAGGTQRLVRDAGAKPMARTVIRMTSERLNGWLGTSLSLAAVRGTLTRLGCQASGSGTLRVVCPSYRRDLTQPVDLYEEVARLAGYGAIPSRLPRISLEASHPEGTAAFRRVEALRQAVAALGLTEVITWSLISAEDAQHSGSGPAVTIANPLSQDHTRLRPALLMGLLRAVRRNLTQGRPGVAIFELGNVFLPEAAPRESLRLGIALSGWWAQGWQGAAACDFSRLKGLVETLCAQWAGTLPRFEPARAPWAQDGHAAAVSLDRHVLGTAAAVARTLLQPLDIEQDVWVAELDAQALLEAARMVTRAHTPTALPAVKRDLSCILGVATPYREVEQVIREAGGPLMGRVVLADRYTGRQIPAGKHSLTFSIEYRDPARTLTADEADHLHQQIGRALVDRFGAQLR